MVIIKLLIVLSLVFGLYYLLDRNLRQCNALNTNYYKRNTIFVLGIIVLAYSSYLSFIPTILLVLCYMATTYFIASNLMCKVMLHHSNVLFTDTPIGKFNITLDGCCITIRNVNTDTIIKLLIMYIPSLKSTVKMKIYSYQGVTLLQACSLVEYVVHNEFNDDVVYYIEVKF